LVHDVMWSTSSQIEWTPGTACRAACSAFSPASSVDRDVPYHGSPALVAADPFEYELTSTPLPPSPVWTLPEPKPLPEGHRIAGWAFLDPRNSATRPARIEFGEDAGDVAMCHPRSGNSRTEIRASGRVTVPLAPIREGQRSAVGHGCRHRAARK